MRILISYHYYRDTDLDKLVAEFPHPPEVFADSGAFSAMTQGATIDVHEYATWLKRWEHLFAVYANLDVIGDADTTAVNQRVLEERYGLTPLPVFHVREPWEAYDALLQRYDYVALGVAGHHSRIYMPWVVKCHVMARNAGVRLHGFGITDYRACKALPWYTVDSSSWGKGHRFGIVSLWNDRTRRFHQFKRGDHRAAYMHAELLAEHRAKPEWFAGAEYSRAQLATTNAVAYVRFEAWLRQHHGLIPPPESALANGIRRYVTEHSPDADGVRMYLADGGEHNLRDAAKGLRLYLADNAMPNFLPAADGVRLYLADARPGSREQDLAVAAHMMGDNGEVATQGSHP